jgi:hypothetical protein
MWTAALVLEHNLASVIETTISTIYHKSPGFPRSTASPAFDKPRYIVVQRNTVGVGDHQTQNKVSFGST